MPSRLRSLRTRLLAGHGALFAALLLGAFLLLDVLLRQAVVRQVDGRLLGEAARILDLAARRKPRILQEEFERLTRLAGTDEVLFRLADSNGVPLAGSGPGSWMSAIPAVPPRGTTSRTTVRCEGTRIRWMSAADAAGRTAHVARSLAGADRLVLHARITLLGGLIVSLASGLGLAGSIAGQALDRVDRVRRTAIDIASGDLSRRVVPEVPDDEIAALGRAFNSMLDRIEILVRELKAVTDDIAHELRTPITRIRCAMEEHLAGRAPVDWPASAAMAVEECDRLARMIDVMLRIARLEAGKGMAEKAPVGIASLLQDAAEVYLTVAEDRNVRLEVAAPPEDVRVMGDRSCLQRAVANLIDNAVKFTPSGGTVRVAGRAVEGAAEVEVADTGPGIAADDLPRVFERFFRAGSRPGTEGAGLGLCLVRAIAEAHGGTVSVRSTPGAGAVFTIRMALSP